MNEKPNTTAVGDVARPAGSSGDSLMTEAKNAVGHMAEGAKDQVVTQVEAQKDKAAEKIGNVAEALRAAGEPLAELGPLPDLAGRAADQIESIAEYVQSRTVGDIVHEVERFARREPAIFLGAAFGIGLLAGRFLKSSPRREAHSEIQDNLFEEEISFGTRDRGGHASSGLSTSGSSTSGMARSGVGRFETSRREAGFAEGHTGNTWDRPVERPSPGVDRTVNSGFGGYGGSFATGVSTPYDTTGSSVSAKLPSDVPATPASSASTSNVSAVSAKPVADSPLTMADKPVTTASSTSSKPAGTNGNGNGNGNTTRSTGR